MSEVQEAPAEEFVPSPEYLARAQRIQDALELKQPDRVPIFLGAGYLMADMSEYSRLDLHQDPAKTQEVLEELAVYFDPDVIFGFYGGPAASMAAGDRMTKWPGYGLGPEGSFQFNEHDFMKAEDYDAFLRDPSDYAIRTYLPRAFKELEGLAMLPPVGMSLFGYYNLANLGVLTAPPVQHALQTLSKLGEIAAREGAGAVESAMKLAALGYPGPSFLVGALIEAPFDFMSDTLRGMRGIFLDMLRIPDKLLEAEQRVLDIQVEHAIGIKEATGLSAAFIPLHRGSDGFMSLAQFEKFYWPQLKEMVERLVDAGIMPTLFYEGVWDDRLEYLNELPKGKTAGMFQASDIFKVKEVCGETLCIMGGMSISMLKSATVEQVRERTKELCERVGKGGGYIMTTGVLELEGCKPELIKAWVDATKEFGVYE